jgi:hypothetical protein
MLLIYIRPMFFNIRLRRQATPLIFRTLVRANVDLSRKTVTVKGKGDKIRTIPLNAIAFEIIKARIKTTSRTYAHHCPESLRSGVDVMQNYYNSTTVALEGEKEAIHVPG